MGLLGSFGFSQLLGEIQLPARAPARRCRPTAAPAAASGSACAGSADCGSGASVAAVIDGQRAIGIVLAARPGVHRARHQQRRHARRRTFDDELDPGAGRHADVVDPLHRRRRAAAEAEAARRRSPTMPSCCGARRNSNARFR